MHSWSTIDCTQKVNFPFPSNAVNAPNVKPNHFTDINALITFDDKQGQRERRGGKGGKETQTDKREVLLRRRGCRCMLALSLTDVGGGSAVRLFGRA